LTIAMQALRMTAWGRDASWEEAVRPAADATGIVVHFMGNVRRGWRLPYTIGHEVTGWIEEIGADVEDWDIGTPVAIFGAWGCGECSPCTTSREVICRRRRDLDYLGLGLGRDGGMASYVLVPAARLLVALPRGLDPVAAAPLCDAGLTAFHAVDQARHLLAAPARALVIGCGGIGLMVIQVLVARTSAAVIGADIAAEKLDAAREAGAGLAVGFEDARREIGPDGVDVVIDCVGAPETVSLAATVIREGGHVAVIGHGEGALSVGYQRFPFEVSAVLPHWGSRNELVDVLALAAQGSISTRIETIPLREALTGYRRLRQGQVVGRLVAVPDA
jgi:propanol-preferring alcohol dehydrogenase